MADPSDPVVKKMSGKYIKGAFVEMMDTFLGSAPNVITFEFNPDQITHTWSVCEGADGDDTKKADPCSKSIANPLAVKGYPGETFGFKLQLSEDDPASIGNAPWLADATGIYSRLAALEMLLYPVPETKVSKSTRFSKFQLTRGVFGKLDEAKIPKRQLPAILFVYGPGRVLPVRITKLIITETAYDLLVNPTEADVDIELEVLTPDKLASVNGLLGSVARDAYVWSQWQRQALAVANYANAFEGIVGMFR